MNKGFSIVEFVVSAAIVALLSAGLYWSFSTGSMAYNSEYTQVFLQQEVRRAADAMCRELRKASSGNTNLGAGNTTITFNTLDETGITYSRNTTLNQLRRSNATNSTTLAYNITNITFAKNATLITIQLTGTKSIGALGGNANLTNSLTENVRLRND